MLLRAGLGLAVLLQGALYITATIQTVNTIFFVGVLAVGVGVCLLVGFLTPLISAAFGLGAMVLTLAGTLRSAPGIFEGWLSMMFSAVIIAAVLCLGPGSFSVDARLFGPREIIIPPNKPDPDDQ